MSAHDAMRSFMDQMMGAERDVPVEQRTNRKLHFTDDEVCKYYICGLNPYSLFTNTKSHLGPYNKIEDDDCKAQWEALSQEERNDYGYEYELMVFLDDMVRRLDRDIARKQDRVRQENEEPAISPELRAQVAELRLNIDSLLAKSEEEGEEGNVDEALALQKQAEALKKQQAELEDSMKNADTRSSVQKTREVCEISGIYMSSIESEQRKQDHKNGRQYQGWLAIRAKIKELKAKRLMPARRRDRGGQDYRDRDRDRSGRRDRERERGDYRSRDYDRDRRDRRDDDRDRDYDRRDRRDDRKRDYDRY